MVIAEMQRRRIESKERQNVIYQRSVVARVIEQRLNGGPRASDAEIFTGTWFRASSQQVGGVLRLGWHRQRVEPRAPAPLPPIDPAGTFGDDGTVDAGDVAGGTHVRSDGDLGVGDRDGAGFDGDLEIL